MGRIIAKTENVSPKSPDNAPEPGDSLTYRRSWMTEQRNVKSRRGAYSAAGAIGGYMAGELALAAMTCVQLPAVRIWRPFGATGSKLIVEGQTRTRSVAGKRRPATFGPQDVVICALKAQQAHASAGAFAPLLGPHTAVLTAMNGIRWWYFYKERGPLEGHFIWKASIPAPRNGTRLDPSAPSVCRRSRLRGRGTRGHRTSPVQALHHRRTGRLRLGPHRGPCAMPWFSAGFDAADPRRDPLEHLAQALGQRLLQPDQRPYPRDPRSASPPSPASRALCNSMMAEAQAITASLGLTIPEQMMERRLNAAGSVVGHKISMLQDLERGRSLEIDALVTAVQEVGRLVKVATPTIDAVLALVQERGRQAGTLQVMMAQR